MISRLDWRLEGTQFFEQYTIDMFYQKFVYLRS